MTAISLRDGVIYCDTRHTLNGFPIEYIYDSKVVVVNNGTMYVASGGLALTPEQLDASLLLIDHLIKINYVATHVIPIDRVVRENNIDPALYRPELLNYSTALFATRDSRYLITQGDLSPVFNKRDLGTGGIYLGVLIEAGVPLKEIPELLTQLDNFSGGAICKYDTSDLKKWVGYDAIHSK